MAGFTKPTALVRQAKVKLYQKVGAPVPADNRPRYTDRMEFLSAGLTIGYKHYPGLVYPTGPMKAAAVAGANCARRAIAKANDELASVIFLRKKESALLTEVMDKHFGLIEGDDAGGLTDNQKDKAFSLSDIKKHDRRWVLEKIRKAFLHLSFHLNTGIYLIDIDASRRNIHHGGQSFDPATADPNEEAYVFGYTSGTRGCGFRNGTMHVSLEAAKNYTPESYARLIIHEAAHKYLEVKDQKYAHDPLYATLNLFDCLNNADSYAWAAISLYLKSVKMGSHTDEPTDWKGCS